MGTEIDIPTLARDHGLLLQKPHQISHSLTFESPVRISLTGCLGHEEIGALSYTGPETELQNVTIGRFCSIARNVSISPPEHPVDWVTSHPVGYNGLPWFDGTGPWEAFVNRETPWDGNAARVQIGNDVWIGRNVTIRPGVRIGNGAIIAAGAFVNRDIPSYAIAGGVPARVLRYRFDPGRTDALRALEWWNYQPAPGAPGFRYDDVDAFIDRFREMQEDGQLIPFTPRRQRVDNIEGRLFLTPLFSSPEEDDPVPDGTGPEQAPTSLTGTTPGD